MRGLVGAMAIRAAADAPRSRERRRARRRRSRIVGAIVLAIAFLALATRATAGIAGEYQLEFGFAKRALARETADLCANTEGCANWAVGPCRRQSWHRIDCISRLYGANGVTCSFVGIAVWPPSSDRLLLRHKRIHCTPQRAGAS